MTEQLKNYKPPNPNPKFLDEKKTGVKEMSKIISIQFNVFIISDNCVCICHIWDTFQIMQHFKVIKLLFFC